MGSTLPTRRGGRRADCHPGHPRQEAQMFTLAHELAHIWVGETALSDARAAEAPSQAVERWCNQSQPSCSCRSSCSTGSTTGAPSFAPSWTDWRGASRSAPWSSCGAYTTQGRYAARPTGKPTARKSSGCAVARRKRRELLPHARGAGEQAFRPRGGDLYLGRPFVVHGGFPPPRVPEMATFRELGHSLGVGF